MSSGALPPPTTDPSYLFWSFPASSLLSCQLQIWRSRNPTDFLVLAAFPAYLLGTGLNHDPGEKCAVIMQLHAIR